MLCKFKFIFFLLFSPLLVSSQEVDETFYRDGILAKAVWLNKNYKRDSLKTYYKTGQLNEVFYFNKHGRFHGKGYKFDKQGIKLTTWAFVNGELGQRIDHKVQYNKKNKKNVQQRLNRLKYINKLLKNDEKKNSLIYSRAFYRYVLFSSTLALEDFQSLNEKLINNELHLDHKKTANIYDCLASIYSMYEMKDIAIHYKLKAIATSPEQSRLYNNLGSYLTSINSYRLGISYLNKAIGFHKKHPFANWALSAAYSDLEEYEKAFTCVNIAYERQKNLYKLNPGTAENNVQTIRGWVYHKLGDTQKGIIDLKEALDINPNNSMALRHLGVIHHDLSNFDKACNLLQKSKNLGYEAQHDKDDLQIYLDASCSRKKNTKSLMSLNSFPFIHPNPARNIVTVENYDFLNFQYEIYDYNAKLITKGVSIENKIDVSSLSQGIYVLKIINLESPQEFKMIKI